MTEGSLIEGRLFDIARGCLEDGPGLRTTVFFKGCQMRCLWCHNPESWSPETRYRYGDGANAEAMRYGGFTIGVEETIRIVERDRAYYELSGGGLTLSGGEPTMQLEFCLELLKAAKARGIHTCVETNGYCDTAALLKLVPLVDLFLYDHKATSSSLHEELTGVSDFTPMRNLEALDRAGAEVILRCPLVPNLNDSMEQLEGIAELARKVPRLNFEILPYHDLGAYKYDKAGIPRPSFQTFVPDQAYVDGWRSSLEKLGVARFA